MKTSISVFGCIFGSIVKFLLFFDNALSSSFILGFMGIFLIYSILFVGLLKYLRFNKYSKTALPFNGCINSVSIIEGTLSIPGGAGVSSILINLNKDLILYFSKYSNNFLQCSQWLE